jgi:predicted alpha/beta superfamily hydrolase
MRASWLISIRNVLFYFGLSSLVACGGGGGETPDDDGGNPGPAVGDALTLTISQFPASTPTDEPLYVAGSFNLWNPADPNYRLTYLASGKWQVIVQGLELNQLYEYKFTRGSWATVEKTLDGKEIANRQLIFGENSTIDHTVVAWADAFQNPITHTYDPAQVKIIENFSMPQLGRERRLWVYLPPDYATSGKRYPVLYMHDAQNLFDDATSFLGEWGVDETLNELYNTKQHTGVIVVGIDNHPDYRYEEYSPWLIKDIGGRTRGGDGAKYAQFIVETLKPYIDQHYRTLDDAAHTGIAGSSMGGLISLYAGLQYPDVFGRVGVISPYISVARIGDAVFDFVAEKQAVAGQRIYLDIGGKEVVRNENQALIDAVEKLHGALVAIGYQDTDLWYNVVPEAQHNEQAWRARFGDVVTWLIDSGENPDDDGETPEEPEEPEEPVSTDNDKDGLPNDVEKRYGFLNPDNSGDADQDHDQDGLTNLDEYTRGTQLDNADSDADSLPDGLEVALALNPLDSMDALGDLDNDNVNNITEHKNKTKLNDADSDDDGVLDDTDFYPLDKTRWEEIVDPELTLKLFSLPANTPANARIYVAGTFNQWNPASAAHELSKGSDGIWGVTLKGFKVGDALRYKFTRGNWATVEKSRSNGEVMDRTFTVGKGKQSGAGYVENWADIGVVYHETQRGDIRIMNNFNMPQLNRTRTVRVYLPPAYNADTQRRYPVIYLYDGQNVFNAATTAFGTEWGVDETLQRFYYEQKTNGIIAVAIDNGTTERGCEYNVFIDDPHPACAAGSALGDKTNQFIVETLKPYIDKNYRTHSDRANTFIVGSSMGGQMALRMALTYPSVFAKAVVLSPSYQNQLSHPLKMPDFIASLTQVLDVGVYQNMGEAEQIRDIPASTLIGNMNKVQQALLAKGFDKNKLVIYTTPGAKHEEGAWAQRFPDALEWLLKP